MTYDGETPEGTRMRIHIAYLLTRGPGAGARWSKPVELRQTPDEPSATMPSEPRNNVLPYPDKAS